MPTYYAIPDYILDHLTKRPLDPASLTMLKAATRIPTILNPDVAPTTKDEQAKALNILSFDTELPQHWVDKVSHLTGINSYPHFVYSYATTLGAPVPITKTGTVVAKILAHL